MIMMVKVYCIDIKDAAIDSDWLKYVSEEKRQRLSRMRHPQSLAHSLVGDLLVRYLAVQYLEVSNEDLHFETNRYGKPYLVDPPKPFHFSLSHSGHWVVGAVSQNPVGVDVQLMEPIDNNFAQRVMTPEAYEHYLKLPDSQRLDYFYDLWTRQESYLKLTGEGLANGQIGKIGHYNEFLLRDNGMYYQMRTLESNYKLAVCAGNVDFQLVMAHVPLDRILPQLSHSRN